MRTRWSGENRIYQMRCRAQVGHEGALGSDVGGRARETGRRGLTLRHRLERFGRVDHLVLNAWGSANPTPEKSAWWDMVDAEQDYWEDDIYTGFTGQMVIMRFALTYWRKNNIEGNIIWTGSGVAFPGVVRTTYVYPVVKMAMIKMAEVMALSQEKGGYKGPLIRMNVVAPGIVYIEKRGETLEEATKQYGGAERLKRGGGWTPMNVLLDA